MSGNPAQPEGKADFSEDLVGRLFAVVVVVFAMAMIAVRVFGRVLGRLGGRVCRCIAGSADQSEGKNGKGDGLAHETGSFVG